MPSPESGTERLRCVSLCAALVCGIASGLPVASAGVYGLVVGIDGYEHLNPLNGAVNDARDIRDALEGMAARDVRLLLDGEATREAVFRHWEELALLAGAGDVLVFHFAGHGGRQVATLRDGHEAKDNMFLLAGFRNAGEGALQRIVDNEIGHMLASEEEATVVFVADSCFAGGMVRSMEDRLRGGVRTAGVHLADADDAVSQRVRALGEVDESRLGRVIWIYGQDENKVTQEIPIDGQVRGALSHVFSRALRGEADADGDGSLDVRELKLFVNKGVSRLTERRQRPHVNAGSGDLSIRLAARGAAGAGGVDVPTLRIHYPDARPPAGLEGTTEVRDARLADLLYSGADRKLVYRTGDTVAAFDAGDDARELSLKLQGAVDKWRLLEMLAGLASSDDPQVDLAGGDGVYTEGEQVDFRILSASDRTALLFNLAYDGTVQLLSGSGGIRLRAGRPLNFRARVQEPFGADHLVAITTGDASPALLGTILEADGTRQGAELARELAATLDGTAFGVNWVGLFTSDGGDGQ
ncbi:MAG: caspase family protein [Boseongicola sp.]|nr:caspase family protein [Boseongicola sp.]